MNQVVSQGHLVLLLSFIQITIQHLQDGVLGINFSIVVLLEDLNVFLKLLGLGQTQHLTPVSKNLHSVEVGHLLLLNHLTLQVFTTHVHQLGFFDQVLHLLVLVTNADLNVTFIVIVWGTTLHILA